jgi:hypothetical protein
MRHRCEHNLPLTTEEREQWLKIIPRMPFECGRPAGIQEWQVWRLVRALRPPHEAS